MKSKQVVIKNKTGLHARPANLFVKTAQKFESHIELEKEGNLYNGKSILSVLSLGAGKGTSLTIQAEGKDEEEAVRTLSELIDQNLGEEEDSI